jgi:hypothetical protein
LFFLSNTTTTTATTTRKINTGIAIAAGKSGKYV